MHDRFDGQVPVPQDKLGPIAIWHSSFVLILATIRPRAELVQPATYRHHVGCGDHMLVQSQAFNRKWRDVRDAVDVDGDAGWT